MPALETSIATGSDAFLADRDATLAQLERVRGLEQRTRAATAAA